MPQDRHHLLVLCVRTGGCLAGENETRSGVVLVYEQTQTSCCIKWRVRLVELLESLGPSP
jgi:hypothetical protein